MKKSKPNIKQRLEKIKDLQTIDAVPWLVQRSGIEPSLFGSEIIFTKGGDFVTHKDAEIIIEWLAEQFGGRVEWDVKIEQKKAVK